LRHFWCICIDAFFANHGPHLVVVVVVVVVGCN
jgi:hypothetical protein